MLTIPFALPDFLGLGGGAIATNFASGRPALAIIISSPWIAQAIKIIAEDILYGRKNSLHPNSR